MEDKYLTATDLGTYYHLACQLSLWKTFHGGHLHKRKPSQLSSITKATFARGNEWEEILVRRLDAQGLILRFSPTASLQSQLEDDPRTHFYVIGTSFKVHGLFADEFLARRTSPVPFGTFKPDFIEIWKCMNEGKLQIEWQVIDVKSSKSVKVRGFDSV